jgi:uncharacterized membrane protein
MTDKNTTDTHSLKKDIISLLLLALAACYCTLPLFTHYGIPSGQDIILHIFHADQFTRSLQEGVVYPRWIADFNNGYGSPNFVFYSPLSYYFVSAITMFTRSLTASMIVAIWFSFFLSGITMYITAKRMFGGLGSLLAALMYVVLPYHLFNIYIRGTFAELFAFIWFPLIILFLYKMMKSRNLVAMIGLSVSYAGLICTHLVSGYMFTFVIGAYFFYSLFLIQEKKRIIQPFVSIVFGLGLSSVYLLPVIFERKFVQIDYIVTCSVGDYKKNYLFMLDKFQEGLRNFYIPLHTIVVLETILFFVIAVFIRKNRQILLHRSQQNFFLILFLAAFFLTTPLSRPIWDIVPGFPFLQFPWRWVSITELSLCFLVGYVFMHKEGTVLKSIRLKKVIAYLLIILFLASSALILKSKFIPDALIGKIVRPEEISKIIIPYEYTPLWVKDVKIISSDTDHERVSVISGTALFDVTEWNAERRIINIKSATDVLMRISTFYYPGWKASLDNKKTPIRIEPETGAMLIDVPEGEHTLLVEFGDTPIRYYSKFVSLTFLFIMIVWVLLARMTSRTANPEKGKL